MPDRPIVGGFRELPSPPPQTGRPQYLRHIGTWREVAPPSRDFLSRLIYLDREQAHASLEQLAASRGSSVLLRLATPDAKGVVPANNATATLLDLLSQVGDASVFDLSGGIPSDLHVGALHPEQVVVLTGSVQTPGDVRPGTLRLYVDGVAVRVILSCENVLYLNQDYLADLTVKTICKVRSAARMQFQAIAVAVAAG